MNSLLKIDNLVAGYERSQVLFGINMEIGTGQCVSLLGRNGMGKTTTIKNIMGMQTPWKGAIHFHNKPINNLPSYRIAQAGIGLVPEGRQIFSNLSVRENLVATSANRLKKSWPWTLERIYNLFPRLKERASNFGNQLSGGEQQMLAIGRALLTNPELLILDEATEGLSPLVRGEIWSALGKLRKEGVSILIIDKNIAALLQLVDRHYIIEKGKIVWHGNSMHLTSSPEIYQQYLGA